MSVYLDCNATTPIDPMVRDAVAKYLEDEFGNAGSRTHEYGARAKQATEHARRQVASVVAADPQDVVFTSGATESNNLAILGLAEHGIQKGKKHIVTSAIEHKAVLEPMERLQQQGFSVTVLPVGQSGAVEVEAVLDAVREDTLLISLMHANNETGVIQPIEQLIKALPEDGPFLHIDAAQTFGKVMQALSDPRVDLISVSAHKVFGPKGIGALVNRRRDRKRVPLQPLMVGGGQERGMRPGTLPVHLIVGLGEASEQASKNADVRSEQCEQIREGLIKVLDDLGAKFHGDQSLVMPHVFNCSIPGVDSEAAMLALKGNIAISNGSACTSASYTPSHVLEAMGLSEDEIEGAMRFSWCHLTPNADWEELVGTPLRRLIA